MISLEHLHEAFVKFRRKYWKNILFFNFEWKCARVAAGYFLWPVRKYFLVTIVMSLFDNSVKFRRKYLDIFFSIWVKICSGGSRVLSGDQSEKVTHATAVPCTQHLNTLEDTKIHKKNTELHCNTLSSRVLLSYVADSLPH